MPATHQKSRPFPWRCPACMMDEVVPSCVPYQIDIKHDGVLHAVSLPNLKVPRCRSCGELLFDDAADEQINVALRELLQLLSPEQIRAGRVQLVFDQQQLANDLGTRLETIARCEDGSHIQSKTLDNLLRVYFAVPGARAVLQGAASQIGVQPTNAG